MSNSTRNQTEGVVNSAVEEGQGVETVLNTHDDNDVQPTSSERNGNNEASLSSTEEETALDLDDYESPSTKGGKGKEGQLKNWFHEPLALVKLSPASLLASLAVILLSLATYYGVSNVKASNATVTIASSENIAAAANPGTITLNKDGSISISGDVKLPADIEAPQGITLEPGAVLHPDGHSISARSGSIVDGIKVNEDGEMTISRNVKLTADILVPEDLGNGKVAITLLDGVGLDCNDHSITGAGGGSTDGIKVDGSDKTQIKNCDVSGFRQGASFFGIKDVFIENSSFHSNGQNGVYAADGDTFEMKGVTTVNENGGTGIYLDDWDEVKLDNVVASGNGNMGVYAADGGKFEMKVVTAKDNEGTGISLDVWSNVKLKSIVASRNDNDGIQIHGEEVILEDITAEQNSVDGVEYYGDRLSLKGTNSFSNNGPHGNGLNIQGAPGTTVSVGAKAKVIANDNVNVGIIGTYNAAFELKKKGSLEACNNGIFDWFAGGGTTFTGKNYICDDSKINGDGPPECEPCS